MAFLPALTWCPWSSWKGVTNTLNSCKIRQVKRERLHCCLKSRRLVTANAGSPSPNKVHGCTGPLDVDRQERRPEVQCQALSGSSMWGNNFDAQFALIFGSVIFFVGIMWAFCRCCRWWILECNHEDPPINENDQDENYSYQVVRRSLDGCLRNEEELDECELSSVYSYPTRRLHSTGSLRGRMDRRHSTFSVLSASATVGLPLGADAVSLAQQIINRHDSTVTSPILPPGQTTYTLTETLIEEDDNMPPSYNDVTGQTTLINDDLPPAYMPPVGNALEDEPPPGYDEATALTLPPRYEDL